MIGFTSILLALGSFSAAQESSPDYKNNMLAKVLLFTRTDGFRHDSISTAVKQLQAWGPYYNIPFDASEDQEKFTAENLAQYDALLFVHTSGNIFDSTGQAAFEDYLAKGGNFAAVHAASTTYMLNAWAPWTDTLGATFIHHPRRQIATFVKETTGHPATNPTPDRWTFDEEVYSFTSDPPGYQDYSAGAVVKSGDPGPGIAGRSFYSSLGHNNSTWMDDTFMKHIMGGLSWTLASNATRVAAGLYNGAQPTVHTGASNNTTSVAASAWAPVLGSDQIAPPPPPPKTTPTSDGGPESTGGATTPSSSGAFFNVPVSVWATLGTALGAILGALL
ncbi:Trehalose utilization, partial [Rhizoctonia solani]